MKKEDLFEAMQGIDEELIARSERKPVRHHGFRNFVITAAAAACLAVFLMYNGIPGGGRFIRSAGSGGQDGGTAYSESYAESGNAVGTADSEAVSEDTVGYAESETDSDDTGDSESSQDSGQKTGNAASSQAGGSNTETAGGKSSADLLGSLKGDYVKVEYVSAAGGSRKEAVYSDSGANALSSALSGGSPTLKIFADTGDPVYYVYLVRSDGSEDTVTFYENDYVSMSTYKGMVMEIPDSDYQAVLAVFR